MDQRTLQSEAEKLLAKMHLVPPRELGEKLRAADEAKILHLAGQGWTQERIASDVGCHQSTVSRTIAEYDDSRPLARKYLEAKALDMTKRLVTDAKPETILRVLAKLDVVRDDGDTGGESDTHIVLGIGVQMNVTKEDGSRRASVELFEPEDVITVMNCRPWEPEATELMVQRKLEGGCYTMYQLPCDVSEIPPHVKIEPEAVAFIRAATQPPIDADAITDGQRP